MVLETRLYFECHVTIEPVFDERLELARRISKHFGFKVADLLMKKRTDDTEERSRHDTFTTGHSKSYEDIHTRMVGLINSLKSEGFKVWRYKIEDTILDSKQGDELGLL